MNAATLIPQHVNFDLLPLPAADCTDKVAFFKNAFDEHMTDEACTILAQKVIANESLRGTQLYASAERVLAVLNSKDFHDQFTIKSTLIKFAYIKQICG